MDKRVEVDTSAMIRLFDEIHDAFPRLHMQLDLAPQNVDLAMDVPRQRGLAFAINLYLADDALTLCAGAFCFRWFPFTQPAIVNAYREAVDGLLTGSYRIREHYRGDRPFKAELQRPFADDWQTVGTTHGWSWSFSRRTVEKIVQNV